MSQVSLSYLLPVYNAEASLDAVVTHLLDVLPDLAAQFEIMIIDDGSQDDTVTAAMDLSRRYTQVFLRSHPLRYGHMAAVQTGLRATTGDIVIIQDHMSLPSGMDIRSLWEMKNDQRLVMVHPDPKENALSDNQIQDRRDGTAEPAILTKGLRMIRRRAMEKLGAMESPSRHLQVERIIRTDQGTSVINPPSRYVVRMQIVNETASTATL